MTPARRRQLLQARAAFVRAQDSEGNLTPAEERPGCNLGKFVDAGGFGAPAYVTRCGCDACAARQLEELAAQPIDGTTAEKLAEIIRPLPDPPAQDAPRRARKRKKPRTARRGRPPLAEAGGAAERLSVSLAPETLAAIARAAKRRRVRPGTVLRELAEAWAAKSQG